MEMNYCMQCGTKLVMKYHESEEKDIPYCSTCSDYRFPVFNTAVSMVVTNQAEDRILLIKQYGRDRYILVAGYINKGEDAEHAVIREVEEEMNLHVVNVRFNHSHYFAKSNTLMLNYTAIVDSMDKATSFGDSDPSDGISVKGTVTFENALSAPSLAILR